MRNLFESVIRKTPQAAISFALAASLVFALNPPYLISVNAIAVQKIYLTWRNNDLSAFKVLILRKTGTASLAVIDSASANSGMYTDTTPLAGTQYSYALIAKNQTAVSDTSNTFTATTPPPASVLKQPIIFLVWQELKPIQINFMDSSTSEKGFRLLRSKNQGNWVAIDSMTSANPADIALKTFTDSLTALSSWYWYKVQVYNDSGSLFSKDTSIYTYVTPMEKYGYSISRLSAIPASVISWMERVGDSIYFQEKRPAGDTAISIINIHNPNSPSFAGYLDTSNVSPAVKPSAVGARIALNGKYDFCTKRAGYILAHKFSYTGPNTSHSWLYTLDSTFRIYDSVQLAYATSAASFAAMFDDSFCLVKMTEYNPYQSNYISSIFQQVSFNKGTLDTAPVMCLEQSGGLMMHYSEFRFWGCYNKKAVFVNEETGGTSNAWHYNVYDCSLGFVNPLNFSCAVADLPFFSAVSSVFDSGKVFTCIPGAAGVNSNQATIYAYDIANLRSGPQSSSLGDFIDTGFHTGSVVNILLDTTAKLLAVAGDSQIVFYSYRKNQSLVKRQKTFSFSNSNQFSMKSRHCDVEFTMISSNISSISILDISGRIVSNLNVAGKKQIVWNWLNANGNSTAAGCYFALPRFKDNTFREAMRFIIRR